MPLRVRLIILIGLMLLVSLASGSVLVGWHAVNSVRTELRAALDVGTKTMRTEIDRVALANDRRGELRRLIATFNGNRHVRATLLGAQGQQVAASELFPPTQAVPGWFLRLIGGQPRTARLPITPVADDGSAIVLQTDPTNETGEVWADSRDTVLILAGFAALSALLISAVIGRALRSLEKLSDAFEQIGTGDYHGLLPAQGAAELKRLANGFNLMTQRLATFAAQNHRLNERLLTMQAEERADLARDLHDEIGPLLFAVDMTAAAIERVAGGDREAEIPAHVQAIHDAVGRMQRHVRMILERLRPMQGMGLEVSIDRLVTFWRGRRSEIAFGIDIAVDEERIGSDLKETIYRVVQESMSNAIRHARPSRVDIAITADRDGIRVAVTDDGIGMRADSLAARGSSRFGLVGMRERVMAMAGSLAIESGPHAKGLSLTVQLPCEDALQSQHADSHE
jgi:two-component system sensor histidine kinase UhpB